MLSLKLFSYNSKNLNEVGWSPIHPSVCFKASCGQILELWNCILFLKCEQIINQTCLHSSLIFTLGRFYKVFNVADITKVPEPIVQSKLFDNILGGNRFLCRIHMFLIPTYSFFEMKKIASQQYLYS